MLTRQRHQFILTRLTQTGEIVAASIATELQVSEDTIRRDLRHLAKLGQLQRVHGGALPSSPAVGNMQVRANLQIQEKMALGRAGAALVEDGMVITIDGGTTAAQLVAQLPTQLRATVVTHSPNIACSLAAIPGIEIVLLGGRLFRHSMVNVGSVTVSAAKGIRSDLFFLGVTGIHPSTGFTTGDYEEAQIKQTLLAQSAETIVLASQEKLGAASNFFIAPPLAVARMIVSKQAQAPAATACLTALKQQGMLVQAV
jgi:DeoR/GlpR family transcriptional regulator of sugar metabolism